MYVTVTITHVLFILEFIHTGIYSYWNLFILEFIHIGIYSYWNLFILEFINTGIYSYWNLFILEFIHTGIFFECDMILACRLCSLVASGAIPLGPNDKCTNIVPITGVYLRKCTMSESKNLSESQNLKSYFFPL